MEENEKHKQKEINDLCFFRPLLPGFSKRMPLPQDLEEHLNMDESRKTATLVSHIDKTCVWHVDFHKEKKEMFIEGEGWKKFVEAHDLRDFYMLVFRYRGNMVFTFRVFDKMTYCKNSFVSQKGAKEKEILNDHHEDENTNIIQKPTKSSCRKREAKDLTHLSPISLKRVTRRSKDQFAGEREKHFARKVSFEATVKPCNLNARRYGMKIPSEFIKSCGLPLEHDELVLCDPDGRNWLVGLSKCIGSNTIFISKGWPKFARGNKLKEGDRCIFELVASSQGNNKLLNVKILKCTGTQQVDQTDEMENLSVKDLSTEAAVRPTKSPEDHNTLTKLAKGLQFEATILASNLTSYGMGAKKKEFLIDHHEDENANIIQKQTKSSCRKRKAKDLTHLFPISLKRVTRSSKDQVAGEIEKNFARKVSFEATVRPSNLNAQRFGMGAKEKEILIDDHEDENTNIIQKPTKSSCRKSKAKDSTHLSPISSKRMTRSSKYQVAGEIEKNFARKLSFEATVKPSNLNVRRFGMKIPSEFIKSCGLPLEHGELVLCDPEGQNWLVGLFKCKGSHTIFISKGWPKFARGNKLKEGDRCIFELAASSQGNNKLLNVRILKCTETRQADETDEIENLSLKKVSTRAALRPTKSPVDDNTLTKFAEGLQFEATISAYNLTSHSLYIPREFEKSSGLDKLSEVVLRDPKGQRWPVALCHRRTKRKETHMLRGWTKFASSNNIKEGHHCIFKLLTQGKGNVLQVQVLRRRPKQVQVIRRRRKKTGRLMHFEAKISYSCLKRSDLYIRRFEGSCDLEGLRKVILIDPAGQCWPVGVVHRIRRGGLRKIYMRKGWREFAHGNRLQNGDKCIFDELDGYVDVLQVQFLKRRKGHR